MARMSKPKTVLETGDDGSPRSVPWFQDFDKLLAAVVRRANDTDSSRKLLEAAINQADQNDVIDAVIQLAADSKKLRGRIAKGLESIQGGGTGKAPVSNAMLLMIAGTDEHLREIQNYKPGQSQEKLAEMFSLSPSRIRTLISRGRKLRDELGL